MIKASSIYSKEFVKYVTDFLNTNHVKPFDKELKKSFDKKFVLTDGDLWCKIDCKQVILEL